MNLLNSGNTKKKWIIVSIIAVLILGIIVTSILLLKNKDTEPQVDESPLNQDKDKGNPSDTDGTSQNTDDTTQSDFGYSIPTEQEEGSIATIDNKSTFAELTLQSERGVKQYIIDTNSIVFNVETNTVERVSSLTKNAEIQVLSSPNQQGVSNASAILLNNEKGVEYSPVMDVLRTEDATYLVNNVTGTQYQLEKGTKVTNALTGKAYNEVDLKEGDRLFIYKGEKVEAWKQTYESDDVMPEWLEKSSQETDYVTEEDVSSNLKMVKVSEVYVYPY